MSSGKSASKDAMPASPAFRPDEFKQGELEQCLLAAQEDITLLCGSDTTILYASPSISKTLGYGPDDVTGTSFVEFIHPEDIDALAAEWQRFQNRLKDDPVQYRTRRRDGSWGWFEARATHIDDPRLPDCACVTIREAEHHYRLRARVAAAEGMAKIGSWRWFLKGGEPEWTASMYHLLGYEPCEGALDLEWAYNLIHPDDREDFRDHILGSLEKSQSFTVIKRMRAATGEYRSIIHHCHTEKDAEGAIVAMIGICQDVTAQTKAEQALRESEHHYRVLADEASDLIIRYDDLGRCTFASAASQTVLGYKPEEMEGVSALTFVHRDDRPEIQKIYDDSKNGVPVHRVSYRALHNHGHHVWLEASVRTLFDSKGDIAELIVVARDVTERRQHEEELRQARKKAEAANITKSRFLANMSHELRTPLNAVIGFSDIMREELFGPLGSEQYSDYTRLIHESGQFLLELINDILDMSKIEAGKYKLFVEEISLDEMIEGCLRIVETRARDRGVTLNWSGYKEPRTIFADERAVKQVLLNLLSNAIKFTDEGGSVTVAAECEGGQARISIADTGCGIPARAIPRLAQPFEQVTTQTNQVQTGTGLGLALVKSFVELHGGELFIESIEGEGTTMSFTLPLQAAAKTKSA